MDYQAIRFISNIFIISGIALFAGAVILAFLRYKSAQRINFYNLKRVESCKKEKDKDREKRARQRVAYSKEVKLKHPETDQTKGIARGRDLSMEGVGLYVPVDMEIKPGTRLEIEPYFEEEEEPIEIGAEVVWTEDFEDEGLEGLSVVSEFFRRRIGLKFTDIDAEKRQKIDIYIRGISKDNQQDIL